jgi:hypothetical protein
MTLIGDRGSADTSASIRLVLVAMLIVGTAMMVLPVALQLPAKTQGVDDLTNAFRESFRAEALAASRADMDLMTATIQQLQSEALPTFADEVDLRRDELEQLVGDAYPEVGDGLGQMAVILPYFDGLITSLEAQEENFRRADAIPLRSAPTTLVPYLLGVPGALIASSAAVALFTGREKRRPALITAALTAVSLVALPLLWHIPDKAQAVDDFTAAFRPSFTEEGAQQMDRYMTVIEDMSDAALRDALPGLASLLGTTRGGLDERLQRDFPTVHQGLQALPEIVQQFRSLVEGVEANRDTFELADGIPSQGTPTTLIHWLYVVPGLLVLALSAAALIPIRRSGPATPGEPGERAPHHADEVLGARF